MKQEVKKLLKSWESSLERYSKLDSWKIEKDLAILGEYLRGKEDSKSSGNWLDRLGTRPFAQVSNQLQWSR
jgi:hypothetical protein